MHVALYSPSWPPTGAANGIVSYVSIIRDYLIDAGHQVSVLSASKLHLSDGRCIALHPHAGESGSTQRLKRRIMRRVDRWHGAMPGLGRKLAAEVRAAHDIAPIDILEMEESFGWSDTIRRLSGVPVVTRLHGPHFLNPNVRAAAHMKRNDRQKCRTEARAVRSSATVTAPTRAIMEATCDAYRRRPGKHDAVIPNPIQLAPENQRWSLADCDRNHILMVGRFDYAKGADTMLLAFDKVLESHPAARLTLVGPIVGIDSGDGAALSFEEFAQRHLSPEAAGRVMLTGTLDRTEIARLRQQALVGVIASRTENFPYALLEGLAAGAPMLSTAWPASNEIIADGETGFLTPVTDPDAMAARLAWLMDHPEAAARVGANGRSHCGATFSMEAVGKTLLECFEATARSTAR